jgi:cytoskeletal protein CcmA (bactofilin family)
MSWFAHKLRSGALQFTVFVAVLIALLLAGIMLYAYTFVYMKEQSKGAIENIKYSDLGIDFLLHQSQTGTDTTTVDFIKKENQSLKVHLSQWGVFEKAVAISQFRKKIFVKTAIIGSQINTQESPTLFLQETQNPLTIVGNTAIRGIAYLPSQGVKPGYIAGNSYYGAQLIYGTIKKSTTFLPKLNPTTLNSLTFYLKEYVLKNQEDFINLETTQRITNSFKKKTKGGYSKKQIILENSAISGNIIIKSDTLIRVKNTAFLKDIILIAPIIEIEDGTKGNFQCIASKKITVQKNCILEYPSALVLFQDNKTNQEALSTLPFDNQIFIDSGSVIKGSVCYFQTNELTSFLTQIVLQNEAKIKGQVYCNGNFELLGTVSGSVFTKQFVANQSGSIFINHIYNGIIENENIPAVFGGIILENEPKTVLKWLY